MSTKALRELLAWAERGDSPHAADARAELEAIERAAADVMNEEMEDADVRVSEKGMTRHRSACDLFERIAREPKR